MDGEEHEPKNQDLNTKMTIEEQETVSIEKSTETEGSNSKAGLYDDHIDTTKSSQTFNKM